MNASGREIEAKFLLPRLEDVRLRVLSGGGRLIEPRSLELNLRFDDEAGRLAASGRVLRLRRDRTIRLTYKGPGPTTEERTEVELEIESADAGRQLLEALGYRVVAAYEKYRETFAFGDDRVMLDELPFGYFAEIEADSFARLRSAADSLGFLWESRVRASYLDLFYALRPVLGLESEQATFAAFEGRPRLSLVDLEAVARRVGRQEAPA
jgi:adenylate cyclase, class 2